MGLLQADDIRLPEKPAQKAPLAPSQDRVVVEKCPGVPGGHEDGQSATRG